MNIKGKTVLILGANPETVSLVLKAKALGLRTIVTDYDADAYAKRFADVAANVDACDVDELVNLAKKYGVDGVLVGVAEALLPAYCELCSRLGMPAYSSVETFANMTDKIRFKKACEAYGVGTAEGYDASSVPDDAFPVIVKPVDGCSSRGISICATPDEVERAVSKGAEASRSQRVVVERYLTGDEFIAYYAMRDGDVVLAAACDRYTYSPGGGAVQLPTAYIFPSKHVFEYMRSEDANVRRLIAGEGLKDGSVFLQGFRCPDGRIRFYEPGYRLNGAQEHLIVGPATGLDVKDLYIDLALGGGVLSDGILNRADPTMGGMFGCKLSPIVDTGRIARIEGLEEISELRSVVSINPSYREGDEITGKGTLKQIACRFFMLCEQMEELKESIDFIQEKFRVFDESGRDMVIGKFDTQLLEEGYR